MAQPFVPAAEAQPNAVPNTPENKVPKSNGGQGVKSSTPDGQTCFRCKQPGHLKKDCPELPYCSRCHTRGHIPAKCPTKNKGNQQQDIKHKNGGQQMGKRCENWKQTQDQPQFSNPNNRCLHGAGNHGSCDCPTRHQHQAPPTNNAVGSTSINSQYSPCFSQPSPPQHSQQSVNSQIINTNADDQQSAAVPTGTPETHNPTGSTAGKPAGKTYCFSSI